MTLDYHSFEANCIKLEERIANACERAKREPASVAILPVTKTHPVMAVHLAAQYGFTRIGENKVQEAATKKEANDKPMCWDMIGHLQSNKASLAASTFDRIQSVDSLKIARKLDKASGGKGLAILMQVNTGEDAAKFGLSVEEAPSVLEHILEDTSLKVEGLMTVGPLGKNAISARHAFERLRLLRDALSGQFNIGLSELSMGMSGDLEDAILEGSTLIRVGSALFGERDYAV